LAGVICCARASRGAILRLRFARRLSSVCTRSREGVGAVPLPRHCERRAANQTVRRLPLDCVALLAMTGGAWMVVIDAFRLQPATPTPAVPIPFRQRLCALCRPIPDFRTGSRQAKAPLFAKLYSTQPRRLESKKATMLASPAIIPPPSPTSGPEISSPPALALPQSQSAAPDPAAPRIISPSC
jgi:hypothetical protein